MKYILLLLSSLLPLLIGCGSPPQSSPSATTTSENGAQVWNYLANNQENLQVCQDGFDRDVSQQSSNTYQVSEGKYLVEFLCIQAAYQSGYEYYMVTEMGDRWESKSLSLTIFEPDQSGKMQRQDVKAIGGLTTYEESSRILTVFSKGNGAGTCGSLAKYKLADTDTFELLEYRSKPDCDGDYMEPDQYPRIYPQ